MGFKPYTLLLGILFTLFSLSQALAQDNLVVEYDGALGLPNFLNICGEPDTARMTVRITGLEIEPRENIVATVSLFQGARFSEFIAAESDAGVTLVSSGLDNATFTIPDLDPFVTTSVDLVFTLHADCSYVDTINANNQALVFDTWDLSYDLDGSSLMETDMTAEYKDAFAVPNLTISNTNNVTISSIGECFDRDLILSNSGLSGFIDSLEYSAIYGEGITVTNVQVNGIDYPLVKTAIGTDTLYEMVIVGSYLEQNTLGNGMGDGDQSLDPDESLVITETLCVLSCDDDRSSNHEVSWGCYGAVCETETITNFVTIGSGTANPVATNSGTVANETTGYCKDGSQTVTFTNAGNEIDPGYGTMRDVELGIGLGNDFLLDVERFEIFSVTVAGITITTSDALIKLDDFVEFQTDPDGPGGLQDWDNDGYFDDLPINESIEITVGYRFDCTEANSLDDNCENPSAESLHSQILYTNSCAERILMENNSVIRPSNITPDSESSTDTDAMIATETFHVQYFQLRTVSNFDKACSGDERMIVTVDLPAGVSVDLAETNLFRNTSIALPLVSTNTVGTVTELIYDASVSNFISGSFTIDLALTSDCTAEPGATTFPVTLAHYCPDCDCTHTWFCGDLDGPILHPSVPPCTNLPPCPNGIRALDFEVNRTTYGYTDETYTQQVDPNDPDVNNKVALSCDSVMMTVTSVVGDDVITDDVGVIIRYDNPEDIMGTDEIFIFDGAEVEVRQTNGAVATCSVDASAITVSAVDLNKTLDIELDACLASIGLTLSPDDTIIFNGIFHMNPDGPYNEQFKLVPNFRGEMYHTFAGDQLSCDNFGETFTIAKTGSLFTFPSTPSFPSGCRESDLDYKVVVFNNDFGDFYPDEFIPAAFVDSMTFTFDPAILDAFEDLKVEVQIPNHPIHGNDFYEIQGLDAFPNGEYVAAFDTLNYIPSYNTSFSAAFTLRVNLVANCGSETASSNGDNLFTFVPTIYYRDRIYAETIGDGSCANYVEESVSNNIFYTEAPTFSLQSLSNPNPQVMQETVEWVLQHCNTSNESDAGLNWFALDIPSTSITIENIQDISTGTPVDVPFTQYGTNNSVFAYVDPLLRNFSSNAPGDICNTYVVTASFNECGTFPLVARTGWNCTEFDDVDWTPLDYAPCSEDTVNLSVTTLQGALDAEVLSQPTDSVQLCDTLTYEILVRNTDLGNVYDMNNQFFLPLLGLDFVPNSFEAAYTPSNTFVPISDPTLLSITPRGESYQFEDFSNVNAFLDSNGLPGFNAETPTDSNEYVIRFKVIPNCNFVSGEQIPYSFQGSSGCGDSTNIEFGETFPIFIEGVPEPTQFFLAEFGPASSYDPSGTGTLEVSISNITGQLTDDNDVIRVILPEGVSYTDNSVMPTSPVGWIPGEPQEEVENGFNVLYWDMPVGLPQAGVINFTFDYTGDPILECETDTLTFNLFTMDMYEINCGVTNEICMIFAGTTEGGEQNLDLIVTNGITFEITNATSDCVDDSNESVTVNGSVDGIPTLLDDAELQFFYDANMDGMGDPADDVLLAEFVIPQGTSGDVTFSETFNVSNTQLCDLIMVLDTLGTGACNQPDPLVISPQLQNAGLDANYCGNSIQVGNDGCGNIGTYTYLWSAIAPASDTDISDVTILNPIITLDPNLTVGTTVQYVLETTRAGCGYASTDTIDITVLPDLTVDIDDGGSTVVCNGVAATLTANASEAVTYSWSDGNNEVGTNMTLDVSPATNTTYTVVVTNPGGCTATASVDITTSTGLTSVEAGDNETICLGSSTTLQGTATGGTGTLTYEWTGLGLDNPNIANPVATPSVTTTYTLVVTDEDGCSDTDQVIITVDNNVPEVSAGASDICVGMSTELTASGGTSYTWTEMPTNPEIGTLEALNIANPTFTPSQSGTYDFEVLIEGGCEDITLPVSVTVTSISITTTQGNLDQCDGDVQSVTITLEENIQNYTITGGPVNNEVVNDATLTFDAIYNAGANNYTVELEGVSGCIAENTFEFTPCDCVPTIVTGTIVVNSSCDESSGSATINITGNPNDYSFTWTPNQGTPNASGDSRTGLEAGTYQVVIAENGNTDCTTSTTVVIGNSDGPMPTSVITTPATCSSADGTATIEPSSFTYDWSDGGTGDIRTDLTSGIYGVTVTDPEDPSCINVIPVVIQEDNDLVVDHNVIQGPTCGNNDGSVEITVTGGSGNYNYVWSNGGTGNSQTDLAAGTYVVNISEIGGDECTTSYIFAIVDTDVPQVDVVLDEVNDVSCPGDTDGSVEFTVTLPGGIAGPVDTIITDGFTEWTNGALAPGQYCVEIRDANGCLNGAVCFEIESPEPLMSNINTSGACGDGGSVTVNVMGGTGIYTFDWAHIPGTSNPANLTNLTAGNYDLTITDGNGCSMTLDGGIDIDVCPCDVEPEIDGVIIQEATCGNVDGEVTILVSPTSAGLEYTWEPDNGNPTGDGNVRTNLVAGGYTVTVSDPSGVCFDIVTFAVNNEDGPELDGPIVTAPANCGASDGTATLTPANYTYDWSDGGTGNSRNDLAAGTYFVSVSDADPACFSVFEIEIDLNNTLDVTVAVTNDPTCGNADGEVTANPINGSGSYSYEWSFGGTGNATETNIPSGIYAVTVTDDNATECTASTSFVLVDSDVAGADIVINGVTDVGCGGENNGMVDFTVTPQAGFQGPETIIISDGNSVFENGQLPGGDFCIAVLDANGCVAGGACFTIEENEPLDVEFSITSGCGDAGSIDINVNGGTGMYTFDWADLPGTNDPEDRDNLTTGNYSVTISDSDGCTVTGVDLPVLCTDCDIEPTILSTTIFEATCGNADGGAIVNLDVDPTLAVFTWNPDIGTEGATGNIRTDLPSGDYEVTVSDATGACSDVVTFAITNQDGAELDDDPATTDADCGTANGTATLLPATYDYSWSDNGTGNERTDLEAGTYFVTFFDPADPVCTGMVEVVIGQNNTLEITVAVDTAPTCGNADGAVTATVTGGSGNYQYNWSFGGTNASESGLSSGMYMLTVTDLDSPECISEEAITLIDSDVTPANIVINSTTDESCAGFADGEVDFTVTPNTGLTVVISDGTNTYTNGALPAGEYCIIATDDNDCVAGEACFTIEAAEALDVEFSISGGCNDDGAINVTVFGGTGNYTYDWSDLPGTNNPQDRTDLVEGIYTLEISDENGCTVMGLELPIVCDDCDIQPTILSTTIFEATCNNSDGGAIINLDVDPSLAVYTWNPNVGTIGATGNIRSDLPSGSYTVTVADPSGLCFDVVTFAITNQDAPELDGDPVTTNADCGQPNGTATLLPVGYDYSWSDSGTGNERTDLLSGTYFVTYFDPMNPDCSGIVEIIIGQNNTLDIVVGIDQGPTCGNADGAVTATVTGGSGNYEYAWSFGGTNASETGIPSGIYTLTVTDLDSPECVATEVFTLIDTDVTPATITINGTTGETCAGQADGTVDFTVTPNTGLDIVITNGSNTFESDALPAGDYCIVVTDDNGCITGESCFTIDGTEPLDVEFSISGGCGVDNGAIDVTVFGGSGNYTYDWSDLPGTNDPQDRENLPVGIYTLEISDDNGCMVMGLELPIECDDCDIEPNILSVTIFEATCGNTDGGAIINLDADPSLAVYTWEPNIGTPGTTGNIRENLPAGAYTVTVSDPSGSCTDSVTFAITNSDGPDLDDDPVTTPADCGVANGTATLLPATLDYVWSDGTTGNERTDLNTGTYFVTISDPSDPECIGIVEIFIDQNDVLEVSVTVDQAPTCGNADGAVTAVVANGSGNYAYNWSFGGTNASETGISSGTYTLEVTDLDNPDCSATTAFILIDGDVTPSTVTINEVTNETCAGESDGNVDFDVNPSAGLNITITDGTNTFTNGDLPPGDYCIEVTDDMGCVAGGACFTIEAADALDVEFSISGGCENDGAINVSVLGGTGNYTYDWADIPGTDNDPDRVDLEEGTYTLNIMDENGCTVDGIDLPVECTDCDFDPNIVSTTIYEATCGNEDGEAIINIDAIPAQAVYTWEPNVGAIGNAPNVITGLPAGAYTVTVSDPTGLCSDVVTFAVTNEDGPALDDDPITTAADCGAANGTAELLPASYNYAWSDTGTGNFRDDLVAGTYFVTVTDTDPDCPTIVEITIDLNNTLEVTVTVDQAPTCGNADGTVTATTPQNGAGNYDYNWSFGGTNATETGLSSGTYAVTVTDLDNAGCTASTAFILIDGDVTPSTVTINDTTNESCAGANDGSVDFDVNPSAGLNITITDGINTYTNGTLPPGNYCIEVTDDMGCVVGGDCFTIEAADELDVEFSISGGCASDGAIDISVNGGTGDITFDWLDIPGEDNDPDRTDLEAGTYTVVIADENGCTVLGYELVVECGDCVGPFIDYTISFESQCGAAIGNAQVVLENDPAGYNFTWSPDTIGVVSEDGTQLSNIPAGVYQVIVTDTSSASCVDSISILVTNENGPEAEIIETTASLCGEATGTATLAPDSLVFNWSDGGTGAVRDELAAGIYEVIYYVDGDSACYNALLVEIQDTFATELTVDITQEPNCGEANGSATINVVGGSGNFSFFWSDGGMGASRSDLSSGTYTVFVTDLDNGCENQITFTINDDVPETATIDIVEINNIACNSEDLGSVVFDVTYDPAFNQPASVTITDGLGLFAEDALPAGDYCIVVRDADNCIVVSECFTITETDPFEVSIIGTYAGCEGSGDLGSLDVTVMGGTAPYTFDWADLTVAPEPEDRDSLDVGLYDLTITDANGCSSSIDGIMLDSLCIAECDFFDGIDTIVVETINCEDTTLVCSGVTFSEFLLGDYSITIDGEDYMMDPSDACESDVISGYTLFLIPGQGNSGPYTLESWDVGGNIISGTFDDIDGLVDSMNVWDPAGNWMLNDNSSLVIGGEMGVAYGDMVIYPTASPNLEATLDFNIGQSVSSVGINVAGEGMHEVIIINNETACPDTLIVQIVCLEYELTDSITLGDSIYFCLNTMELIANTDLEGPIVSLENACPESSGTSVIFNIESEVPPCISYLGITPGVDTACLVLCDTAGICDTVNYIVTVGATGPITVTDTIIISEIDTFCLDTLTNLCGEIQAVNNFCDDGSSEVIFEIIEETWCVTYEGMLLGVDSACLEVIDEYGNADTVTIVISVEEIRTDTICDTIFIGQVVQYCIDTTELLAPIESITNECPDQSGEFVEFFIEEDTWCIIYEGVDDVGTDSACIVVCDEMGICDTTIFCITVIEFFDAPIANDDFDTTFTNVPIVINVKANDTVYGGIDSLYIIDGPQVGTATVNLDCTITYDPDEGVCSVEDFFTYVVCNPNECDTATVYIYIECTELTIFNGFSPNGDGVNDVFYIDGIEDFPNNKLCIYNRWGNKVYEKDGYNNEWDGSWSGNVLPDGTYFYVLNLGDEDNTTYNGYLQIFR